MTEDMRITTNGRYFIVERLLETGFFRRYGIHLLDSKVGWVPLCISREAFCTQFGGGLGPCRFKTLEIAQDWINFILKEEKSDKTPYSPICEA